MTQEELIQYLKENLKIKVSRDTEVDGYKYGYLARDVLKVSLILDGHVVDYDTVYLGN